jgi:hypothetical protein
MKQAIRVDSGFATPYDTARVLGVSKSRTEALIKMAKQYTDRILKDQAAKTSQPLVQRHARRKSAVTVARKSRVRDGGTKVSSTKSKAAKANY